LTTFLKPTRRPCCRREPPRYAGHLYRKLAPILQRSEQKQHYWQIW